ncbi:hypothetical protein AAHC03_04981 [Spirometra sp. Aus1]
MELPATKSVWTGKATQSLFLMSFIPAIVLCWMFSKPVLSSTVFVNSVECFAGVSSPIVAEGLVLFGRSNGRESICYIRPADKASFLSVRIDSLHLLGDCSTFRISQYKLSLLQLAQNGGNVSAKLQDPVYVNLLAEATCKNAEKLADQVLTTSDVGFGLMLKFKSYPSEDPSSFRVTVTAYQPAPTGRCPDHLFQCSLVQPKCISSNLSCDTVDNCFDGSDESFTLCSYIGRVPTVLVIVICVSVLSVIAIALIILCVFLRSRPIKTEPLDIPMTELHRRNPEAQPLSSTEA